MFHTVFRVSKSYFYGQGSFKLQVPVDEPAFSAKISKHREQAIPFHLQHCIAAFKDRLLSNDLT